MPDATDVLKLLRGRPSAAVGVSVVQVASKSPLTLCFQGSPIALDEDLFEIPKSFSPINKGDTFFVLPIVSADSQRWAVLQRINR